MDNRCRNIIRNAAPTQWDPLGFNRSRHNHVNANILCCQFKRPTACQMLDGRLSLPMQADIRARFAPKRARQIDNRKKGKKGTAPFFPLSNISYPRHPNNALWRHRIEDRHLP